MGYCAQNLEQALKAAEASLRAGKTGAAFRTLELALRLTPFTDVGLSLPFLVRATWLAICWGKGNLAQKWIQKARKQLERIKNPPEGVGLELDLLELRVAFGQRGVHAVSQRIERAFSQIRSWKPWMLHFRLLALINSLRFSEIDQLIRHPPCRIEPGSAEYTGRLRLLGTRFALEDKVAPALLVLQATDRKVRMLEGLEADLQMGSTQGWLARTYSEAGAFEEASRCVARAASIQKRLGLPRMRLELGAIRGLILYRKGDYAGALQDSLATCGSLRPCSSVERPQFAQLLLNGARCALLLDRFEVARDLLRRASRILRGLSFPVLNGALYTLRGDLERERPHGCFARAAHHYERAQLYLDSAGEEKSWTFSWLCLSRAALFMKQGEINAGLEEIEKAGVESSTETSFDIRGSQLLLKSQLLLQEGAPRAELYETVLRQLGVIREPVVLFKVIANLYMYSWDLGDQLELTDLHLKQLHRLRSVLPPRVHDRLYRIHVAEPVLSRFRRRFGAGEAARRAAGG